MTLMWQVRSYRECKTKHLYNYVNGSFEDFLILATVSHIGYVLFTPNGILTLTGTWLQEFIPGNIGGSGLKEITEPNSLILIAELQNISFLMCQTNNSMKEKKKSVSINYLDVHSWNDIVQTSDSYSILNALLEIMFPYTLL